MKTEHKRIFELLADWQLLGLNIEREASTEPYEGRVAIATIVFERVDHRGWDGRTIMEVILKPWQFSWTMPEAGTAYYEKAVWIAATWVDAYRTMPALQECCEIATGMIAHNIPRDPDLARVHCCQYLTSALRKLTDRQWAEETDPVKKAKIDARRWWKDMKLIKTIGAHEFYA
ncbi:MAG: cell wall hydrolase [Deltaproteobacteria bacterium]|nr:cell wall hydrolase [Deltaproteobacteria bacterium]